MKKKQKLPKGEIQDIIDKAFSRIPTMRGKYYVDKSDNTVILKKDVTEEEFPVGYHLIRLDEPKNSALIVFKIRNGKQTLNAEIYAVFGQPTPRKRRSKTRKTDPKVFVASKAKYKWKD